MNKEKVKVVPTRNGGVIEVIIPENIEEDDRIFHVMLKQGDRYAHLLGDMGFIAEVEYEPGEELLSGNILIKEQLEPFTDDPTIHIKMKNGRACKKDGKLIYQKTYFTCNKSKQDEIIQED